MKKNIVIIISVLLIIMVLWYREDREDITVPDTDKVIKQIDSLEKKADSVKVIIDTIEVEKVKIKTVYEDKIKSISDAPVDTLVVELRRFIAKGNAY